MRENMWFMKVHDGALAFIGNVRSSAVHQPFMNCPEVHERHITGSVAAHHWMLTHGVGFSPLNAGPALPFQQNLDWMMRSFSRT